MNKDLLLNKLLVAESKIEIPLNEDVSKEEFVINLIDAKQLILEALGLVLIAKEVENRKND